MAHEPQFWLTSHNPHVGSALLDWNLYIRPLHRERFAEPVAGEKVMIYEQASGDVDGKKVTTRRRGIVAITEVVAGWTPRKTNSEFTLEAICRNLECDEFVPYDELGPAMGYRGKFPIHGLNGGTGLLPINHQQYLALEEIFKRNPRK